MLRAGAMEGSCGGPTNHTPKTQTTIQNETRAQMHAPAKRKILSSSRMDAMLSQSVKAGQQEISDELLPIIA